MIFFEAPHRTAETLAALAEAFGADRRGAVCRELTKTYEEVRRGSLGDLAVWARGEVRGEITLVIAGAPIGVADLGEAVSEVRRLVADGAKLKPAVAQVAQTRGLSKNQLYQAALKTARQSTE